MPERDIHHKQLLLLQLNIIRQGGHIRYADSFTQDIYIKERYNMRKSNETHPLYVSKQGNEEKNFGIPKFLHYHFRSKITYIY